MFIIPKRQTGFTLIELLIGMLLGLIVAAGAIGLFVIGLQGQGDNIKLARLNQDLRTTMDIMTSDIRRAGFVTVHQQQFNSLKDNPFFRITSGSSTDIAVYNSGSCIVYSYNRNDAAATTPSVENTERLGFRLNTGTGEVEMRIDGTTNENCANGNWDSITEPEVAITALAFTLTESVLNVTSMTQDTDGDGCLDGDDQIPGTAGSCISGNYGNGRCDSGEGCNICTRDGTSPDPACLLIRNVNISLTGLVRDDTSITQTIAEQVRVRNDKFLDSIPPTP